MRVLKIIWSLLRRAALLVGRINTLVLMAASYYLLLLPISLIRHLRRPAQRRPSWRKREALAKKHYQRQF